MKKLITNPTWLKLVKEWRRFDLPNPTLAEAMIFVSGFVGATEDEKFLWALATIPAKDIGNALLNQRTIANYEH